MGLSACFNNTLNIKQSISISWVGAVELIGVVTRFVLLIHTNIGGTQINQVLVCLVWYFTSWIFEGIYSPKVVNNLSIRQLILQKVKYVPWQVATTFQHLVTVLLLFSNL